MATRKEQLPTGFYWRGGVVWVRTDPVTGKPKSTKSRTVDGARAFLGARESYTRDPVHKAAAQATVGKWSAEIIRIKSKTKSEGTSDMYGVKMGHAVRILGRDCPLVEVDAKAIDRYIVTRQGEGAKNNTIQRELTCIAQMLKHARRAGDYHLEMSQVMPIGFSSGYVPRKTFLPAEELPRLLDSLTPERAAWVCVAIATGGDISDVERVRPGDYDPATQTIQMRGTKNRFRTARIPVPDLLLPLLETAIPHLPLSWPRVSADLPDACKRAGVTRVTPKDLRRTAGTWLKEAGVALDTLGRWLRHGGAKVAFDVYDASRPEATGEAIRQQTQDRYKSSRLLGGMADAGDLKASGASPEFAEIGEKPPTVARRSAPKRGPADTDSLHRAEARVRKLRAAVAVDPALGPSLKMAEALVEAHYMGAGDPDAEGRIADALKSVSGDLGLAERMVG